MSCECCRHLGLQRGHDTDLCRCLEDLSGYTYLKTRHRTWKATDGVVVTLVQYPSRAVLSMRTHGPFAPRWPGYPAGKYESPRWWYTDWAEGLEDAAQLVRELQSDDWRRGTFFTRRAA